MGTRKDRSTPSVRLNLERLEDRLAAGNLLPYLSPNLPLTNLASGDGVENAPYQLIAPTEGQNTGETATNFTKEDAARVDAFFQQQTTPALSSVDAARYLLQSNTSDVSEGPLAGHGHSGDAALDPLAVAANAMTDPLSNPQAGNDAATGRHHAHTPPSNSTNGNAGAANALAGIGSAVGGASTPNAGGGGGSSGGGGGSSGATNLLNALGNRGAFDNPALTAGASPAPASAAGVSAPVIPASPTIASAPILGAPEPPHALPPMPSPSAHETASPNAGIAVRPAGGPTIGDPPIAATEGVAWSGTVASVTDSDSDDGQGGGENISGTINWGDNSSSPFTVMVSEGGSAGVFAQHTWKDAGSYTVTITANDSDGGQSQANETATVADGTLTPISNPPGTPWTQSFAAAPAVTTPASQTNAEGDTVSLPITASDPNHYPLTYDAVNLPPGLSIDHSTGLISGTVSYEAAEYSGGIYRPTVIVANNQGGATSTSFGWTINDTPRPPVLTNPGNQTSGQGANVSLQINATQPDGDQLVYDATNLPPGLSIDPLSGLISGTMDPSAAVNTPYGVTVTVTDQSQVVSQSFDWTIAPANQAPVLTSPGDQTNAAGDVVSLQLSADDTDGDSLTYTATGLPGGLSIDPDTGLISGTLPNSAASSTPYSVTVTASDGMSSNSQTFNWTVNAISLQSPGDQSNLDGDSVSLQLTATDANNGTLTYSATGLPPGLSISSSGLISGTISNTADSGSPYSVTVTSGDGTNNASQTFNWTVACVSLDAPGDQENQEGTSVSLQLSATDNVGTPIYSAFGLPTGLSISSSGLITGTIGTAAHGSSPYQVTVTATDGSSTSSQSFVWTVTPRVALVNPGPQSSATGDSVSLQLSATSPGGTMTYGASGLPPGLSISSSGLISGTPTTASSTPYNVTVTASDGTSTSSQTFLWSVSVVNLVAPADQTNNDGDTVSLPLTTTYHGGGTLSYTATGLPPGLSINSSTGLISGTIASTADTSSPYQVTVTASDGTNSSNQTFNWTVNPRISVDPIADQSNAGGDVVSLQVSATDANNATLTYSATGLPSGLTINSTTGLISGTIASGAVSSTPYSVTVTVSDGTVSATQTFNWTVSSVVNVGPQTSADGQVVSLALGAGTNGVTYTATGLPPGLGISGTTGLVSGTINSNADTGSPYFVTVTASDGTSQTFLWTVTQVGLATVSAPTNTEDDNVSLQLQGLSAGGSLVYSASGLPDGLSINSSTGLISGTILPGAAANGPFTVDVAVSNGTVSAGQTFTWTVNPVVALTAPADQSNLEGDNVSLQMTATDSKGGTLAYSADGLPSGLSISSTGLISGTIAAGDSSGSPYQVTVTTTDGTYSTSQSFNWTVTHTDTTTPTLTNPGTQVNVGGDSVSVAPVSSDPDNDPLIFSVTGLPDGLDIDTTTGVISGTLTGNAVSPTPYAVTVTAQDPNGASVSQTFNWIVNDPTIPMQATPLSATEGVDTGQVALATFTDLDPVPADSDYVPTIDWGDGTTSGGIVDGSNGSFTVYGDHTYSEKGTYTVKVTITDSNGQIISASSTATVADAPLTMTGGFRYGDAFTDPQSSYVVAIFADGNTSAPLGDYTTQINWGDGSSGGGMLQSLGNGVYAVVGSHSYANPQPMGVGPYAYTATATVTDKDGATASASSTIVAGTIVAGVQATLGSWDFQDQNPYATATDFVSGGQTAVASINWGDGTTSLGTITGGPGNGSGPVVFTITGTHTYAQDSLSQPNGRYIVTATVTDADGNTLTVTRYVSVVPPTITTYASNIDENAAGVVSNALVAVFTSPGGSAGSFSATINWGDGTSSPANSIAGNGEIFEVFGSHTYTQPQLEPVSVDISWGDPSLLGYVPEQAAPPATPAKMDNLAAILKTHIGVWAKDGTHLKLSDIDRLMADQTVRGADAAAVAVLKGFVLGKWGDAAKKVELSANANVFIKDLDGWDPEKQGLTAADIDYYTNNLNNPASKLQKDAQALQTRFLSFVSKIKGTDPRLFVGAPDMGALKQGAAGDCAFLSATACQIESENGKGPIGPREVRSNFKARIDPQPSMRGVRQFDVTFGNRWDKAQNNMKVVRISGPTDSEIALYASAGGNGLWLSIYEKAYVSQFPPFPFGRLDAVSYDGLREGQRLETPVKFLTGHNAVVYSLGGNPDKKGDGEAKVKAAMQAAFRDRRVITADLVWSSEIGKALEMPEGTAHAFSVFNVDGKGNVSLQNPWNTPRKNPTDPNYGGRFQKSFDDFYRIFRFVAIETAGG